MKSVGNKLSGQASVVLHLLCDQTVYDVRSQVLYGVLRPELHDQIRHVRDRVHLRP